MGSAVGGISTLASGSSTRGIPSANNAAQLGNAQATYGTATSDAAQTMNTAQALNANSQKQLNTTMGEENPMVTNVNNTANQNLSQYGSTFSPLQAQQAKMAQNYTSDANTQQRAGVAVADQAAAAAAASSNNKAMLASEGIDPASVHGAALDRQAGISTAANEAGAANTSVLQTQATGNQLIAGANQLGMEVGSAGNTGAQTGSTMANNTQGTMNQTNTSDVNNLTAANTYLNTGVGAINAGTNAQAEQFSEQQKAYQDQQQAQASKGSAFGGIAKTAMNMGADYMTGGMSGMLGGVAHGGPISPHGALPTPIIPGTTDTKLIAATPGEFMLPKDVSEFMGHDKLHRLIDSTRQKIAERKGIPTPAPMLSSAHTAVGA
ncbi:MAG: hypothetical protein ACHQ9S_18915 [Candidatus Binatia bacterium]